MELMQSNKKWLNGKSAAFIALVIWQLVRKKITNQLAIS